MLLYLAAQIGSFGPGFNPNLSVPVWFSYILESLITWNEHFRVGIYLQLYKLFMHTNLKFIGAVVIELREFE